MYLKLIVAALLGLIAATVARAQNPAEVKVAPVVVASPGEKVSLSDQILRTSSPADVEQKSVEQSTELDRPIKVAQAPAPPSHLR